MEGFRGGTLRGIAYLASAEDIVRLFQNNGFETVEIVLGHGLTGSAANDLKRNLGRDSVESVDHLLTLMESGRLSLYVPRAIDHSKYYIIKAQGNVPVLTGSYNLTGARDVNLDSVLDFDTLGVDRYPRYMHAIDAAHQESLLI